MRPHLRVLRENEEYTTVKAICSQCGDEEDFEFTTSSWRKWQQGALIQYVWPEMTPAMRELLISGLCGVCFDKLFAEDDNG